MTFDEHVRMHQRVSAGCALIGAVGFIVTGLWFAFGPSGDEGFRGFMLILLGGLGAVFAWIGINFWPRDK